MNWWPLIRMMGSGVRIPLAHQFFHGLADFRVLPRLVPLLWGSKGEAAETPIIGHFVADWQSGDGAVSAGAWREYAHNHRPGPIDAPPNFNET